jgi:hypothetical protein
MESEFQDIIVSLQREFGKYIYAETQLPYPTRPLISPGVSAGLQSLVVERRSFDVCG